jgi:hypothetical protein
MNAMWARMSAGGQVPRPASFHPARGACIMIMNFTSALSSFSVQPGRFASRIPGRASPASRPGVHRVVGAEGAFSTAGRVQSVAVTDPTHPAVEASSAPPPDDEPVSDRYRSHTPAEPAEIRRKLLFGVALVLSLVSVYAGLLEWGRVLQFAFAGLAVATVLIALISGATGPPGPTGRMEGPPPGPGPGPTQQPPA